MNLPSLCVIAVSCTVSTLVPTAPTITAKEKLPSIIIIIYAGDLGYNAERGEIIFP